MEAGIRRTFPYYVVHALIWARMAHGLLARSFSAASTERTSLTPKIKSNGIMALQVRDTTLGLLRNALYIKRSIVRRRRQSERSFFLIAWSAALPFSKQNHTPDSYGLLAEFLTHHCFVWRNSDVPMEEKLFHLSN